MARAATGMPIYTNLREMARLCRNTQGWGQWRFGREGGLEGAHMVGSALGAAGGGAVGGIPGSMAGAALAGGGVDAIERAIIGATDKDYGGAAGYGSHLASIATGAGLDAATAGTRLEP